MSTLHIVLLGGIAGSTIVLGLPLGRLDSPNRRLKCGLSAFATGILLFLLFDVLEHGVEPIDAAAGAHEWGKLAGLGTLCALGITAGLLGLVWYDRWIARQRARAFLGPGAASAAEFETTWTVGMSAGSWLALLIATGIGLHNFAEGLAIGQAGAAGRSGLALVLIIRLGLHNPPAGLGAVAAG